MTWHVFIGRRGHKTTGRRGGKVILVPPLMSQHEDVRPIEISSDETSEEDVPREEEGPEAAGDDARNHRGARANRGRYGHPNQHRPGAKKQCRGSKHFFLTWQRCDKYRVFRKIRGLCSSVIVAREYGLNNHGHLHAYLQTSRKWKLPDLNNQLGELGIRADDIEVCRSPRRAITYVTKEDTQACIAGVDYDQTHISFKIAHYSERHEYINQGDYLPRSLAPNYASKLHEYHSNYWTGQRIGADVEEATNHGSMEVVRQIRESEKIGIWLWGNPGSGKSSSAYLACKQNYVEFCDSSNFPLSSYAGESDIVYDDATVEGYVKHRKLILQITSGYMFTYDVKGKNQKTAKLRGKFICTSNYVPPIEGAFVRRFESINLN